MLTLGGFHVPLIHSTLLATFGHDEDDDDDDDHSGDGDDVSFGKKEESTSLHHTAQDIHSQQRRVGEVALYRGIFSSGACQNWVETAGRDSIVDRLVSGRVYPG